jgi:hypothetical protein
MRPYRSIFSPSTAAERRANFENYWLFSQNHAGELLKEDRDLANKRRTLASFRQNPVRSRVPLADPEVFYRNCVHWRDDPGTLDRKVLMLTCIYKFARHEWVGITGAWQATPPMAASHRLTDKISRVHLAEEFCHVRLFEEMLRTFHLDRIEWAPPGPAMERLYRVFPRLPGFLMDPPAFITELMGMVFYLHLDALFDELLGDEPEARGRLHELLAEIMVDELAHIGQRRNFLGNFSTRWSKGVVRPLFRAFFNDLPEARYLFDIDRLIEEALGFDYNDVPASLIQRSWIPSYCRAAPETV